MNKFIAHGKSKQVKGTITAPENAGLRFILNLCSISGKFDGKLQTILSKRWSKVREDYKSWHATQHNFKLGCINTTAVNSDIWVINALCEDKEGFNNKSLDECVKKIRDLAKYERASLHVSRLNSDSVDGLKELLDKHLIQNGINVYFYEEV